LTQALEKIAGRVSLYGGQPVAFFRYSPEIVKVVRNLPGATWIPGVQGWRVSPSAIDMLAKMGFKISPSVLELCEKPKPSLKGFKAMLYPYQAEGVEVALERNRVLIADEMGLGKTIQALAYLQARKDLRPAVIVCPASLKINWLRECEKFLDDCPENQAVALSGKTPVEIQGSIFIINYDILRDWLPVLKPKAVIGDEAHYIKNTKSNRSKAFKKLCKNAESVILLTGTPVLNRPIELYPLLNLLAPHEFSNYIAYGKRYCAGHQKEIITRGGVKRLVWDFTGQSHLSELNQNLKDTVMIRRLKKDVLKDLPPKQYAVVPVEISNQDAYIKAENAFISWLAEQVRKGVYDGKRLNAALKAEALVKINYLKQIAAYGKLNIAVDWITDFLESGEKLVVFAHHRDLINKIAKQFPGCAVVAGDTKNRMNEVDRFQNDPKCRLFIGSIQAAGVGLTLTASSNVAFLEYPWRPADFDQAVDRTHRIGQKSSVTAWCLIANVDGVKTIDEKIITILQRKRKTVDAIVDGASVDKINVLDDIISSFTT
jgi:SWI/SNF-related matrix-associated actin-dependent regulator 1 of chromatin subfamily A